MTVSPKFNYGSLVSFIGYIYSHIILSIRLLDCESCSAFHSSSLSSIAVDLGGADVSQQCVWVAVWVKMTPK